MLKYLWITLATQISLETQWVKIKHPISPMPARPSSMELEGVTRNVELAGNTEVVVSSQDICTTGGTTQSISLHHCVLVPVQGLS